jgi:hypothetical protein
MPDNRPLGTGPAYNPHYVSPSERLREWQLAEANCLRAIEQANQRLEVVRAEIRRLEAANV